MSGTFTFPGSGAVKRFVITTSVNQVWQPTSNLKQLRDWEIWLDNQNIEILFHSGKTNMLFFLKVARNCHWPETVEFTVLQLQRAEYGRSLQDHWRKHLQSLPMYSYCSFRHLWTKESSLVTGKLPTWYQFTNRATAVEQRTTYLSFLHPYHEIGRASCRERVYGPV